MFAISAIYIHVYLILYTSDLEGLVFYHSLCVYLLLVKIKTTSEQKLVSTCLPT